MSWALKLAHIATVPRGQLSIEVGALLTGSSWGLLVPEKQVLTFQLWEVSFNA